MTDEPLREPVDPVEAAAAPMEPPTPEPISTHTFSLATMLLLMTLTALVLGFLQWHRDAGLVLLILTVPALWRTRKMVNHAKAKGKLMSMSDKIRGFGGPLSLTACLAFIPGGICYAFFSFQAGHNIAGPLIGLTIAGVIGGTMAQHFWPIRDY